MNRISSLATARKLTSAPMSLNTEDLNSEPANADVDEDKIEEKSKQNE